jgi:hypothetical protein
MLRNKNDHERFPDRATCWAYSRKKILAAYPMVFFFCVLSTPSLVIKFTHGEIPVTATRIACYIIDYFAVGEMFLCGEYLDVIGPSWYLTCLFLCWILFPFVHKYLVSWWLGGYRWLKLWCLYAVVNALAATGMVAHVHRLAPLRFLEFVMGTSIPYLMDSPVSYVELYMAAATVAAWYLIFFYVWEPSMELFFAKLNIAFVVLIKAVATSTYMAHSFFDLLNPYSLTIYLAHACIVAAMSSFSKLTHIPFFNDTAIRVVVAYYVSYNFHFVYLKSIEYLFRERSKTYEHVQVVENPQ